MCDEEISDALASLRWAMMCNHYGKLQDFIDAGNTSFHDEWYSCFWDVLGFGSDFLNADYDEYYAVNTYYFGFDAMSEYYRLCRTYCVQRGVSLKQNPYMREAEIFVENAMDWGSGEYGGYAFWLQTKINHKWASGLVVKTDENYFGAEFDFAESILAINAWYQDAVVRLKADLNTYEQEKSHESIK